MLFDFIRINIFFRGGGGGEGGVEKINITFRVYLKKSEVTKPLKTFSTKDFSNQYLVLIVFVVVFQKILII